MGPEGGGEVRRAVICFLSTWPPRVGSDLAGYNRRRRLLYQRLSGNRDGSCAAFSDRFLLRSGSSQEWFTKRDGLFVPFAVALCCGRAFRLAAARFARLSTHCAQNIAARSETSSE